MKRIKKKLISSCRRVKTDGKTVIAGTAIVLLAGLLSRFLSGSPLYMLRLTGLWNNIPRAWFFTIVWTLWYILLGFSFGFILGSKTVGKELCKYKGSLWFVTMMVFNIVWYPLFFKAGAVFLALIDIALIIFFCFLAAIEYIKVYKPIGFIFFAHIAWLIWCFFINMRAFLSI
ncbi:MAG: tryptophan-rich sensory protein [Clostridia bacterium]|nr:tryptophan-rich sensory protein [Clostridia bacterium]